MSSAQLNYRAAKPLNHKMIVSQGGLPLYKKSGDVHQEISNESLKGTDLGVAYTEFYPQEVPIRNIETNN